MKKKVLFVLSVLFLLSLCCACSSDDESFASIEERIEQNQIPVELKAIEDLPELLVEYIWDYENTKDPIEYKNDGIYQFSWRGDTYYFHWHPYVAVWFDIIFNSNGSRLFDLTPEDRIDIKENGKNWKLIYRIKNNSKTEIQ
ncbi:MAG: hypothetical protein IKI06_07960 [Prevotella sp.]|nr:hypothetical protein [Prevotella sp.]